MPELPDLLYIQNYLRQAAIGHALTTIEVKQPIVLRVAVSQGVAEVLQHKIIREISIRGPFIRFGLSEDIDIVINLMLMGRLQHQRPGDKPEAHLCVSFSLDDGSALRLCDQQKMAKCYVTHQGSYDFIPLYQQQGIDILSDTFTMEAIRSLAAHHPRMQVRSFLNDHSLLSSIGNAYADEILFDAKIHPKTFIATLSPDALARLFASIRSVMQEGIRHVEEAQQPIHVKVRDHMKVRMHRGEPCPRCGTTIRREGVRGYDVYFCPGCQPSSRRLFLDWQKH